MVQIYELIHENNSYLQRSKSIIKILLSLTEKRQNLTWEIDHVHNSK